MRGRAYRRHQRQRAIWRVLRRWRDRDYCCLAWEISDELDDSTYASYCDVYDLRDVELWSTASKAVSLPKWGGDDSPPRDEWRVIEDHLNGF
jgi:hypothetical protein